MHASSTVSVCAISCVACCSCCGAIKVCPHDTLSMRNWSCSWLLILSPCAANCSESDSSAERQRCKSDDLEIRVDLGMRV